MNFRRQLSPILLAASLALCSQSATADKTLESSITTYGYKLLDLDLNDGITPSVTFVSANSGTAVGADGPGIERFFWTDSASNGKATSSFWRFGQNELTSNFAGQVLGGVRTSANITQQANFYGTAYSWFDFRLSPKTELVLLGHVKGISQSSNGTASSGDYANASYSIHVFGYDKSGEYIDQDAISREQGSHAQYDHDFRVRFFNWDTDNTMGRYQTQVWVNGTDSGMLPTPVPEPESYAMMLAGLGVLGALARRRQKA